MLAVTVSCAVIIAALFVVSSCRFIVVSSCSWLYSQPLFTVSSISCCCSLQVPRTIKSSKSQNISISCTSHHHQLCHPDYKRQVINHIGPVVKAID
uniref:Putative secreted protein n=1 Tax=Xenopsylla cheopis TaxID=163159 RepID=A0A6M2E247_XENCH